MSDGIVVRKCTTLPEFEACVTLQREVWGEEDLEIEPVTGFLVASETGGQVLGAFESEMPVSPTPNPSQSPPQSLVGFALSMPGIKTIAGVPQPYQESADE